MNMKYGFLLLVFVVVVFSLAQFLDVNILGVKPNFALVAVIISIFFAKNLGEKFLLIILSALILKFTPEATMEIVFFIVLGVGAILLSHILPWNHLINSFIAIALLTTIFYVVIGGVSLFYLEIYLKEMVYNLIIGSALFYFYKLIGFEAMQISRFKE